jgi:disulfide bond formation protein DsbB
MRRWLLAAVLICAFIVLAAYYVANICYHLDNPCESEISATIKRM